MTLDVIGLAGNKIYLIHGFCVFDEDVGFNYHFNALTNDPDQNELNKAFKQIFRARTMGIANILSALFPPFRYIVRKRPRFLFYLDFEPVS